MIKKIQELSTKEYDIEQQDKFLNKKNNIPTNFTQNQTYCKKITLKQQQRIIENQCSIINSQNFNSFINQNYQKSIIYQSNNGSQIQLLLIQIITMLTAIQQLNLSSLQKVFQAMQDQKKYSKIKEIAQDIFNDLVYPDKKAKKSLQFQQERFNRKIQDLIQSWCKVNNQNQSQIEELKIQLRNARRQLKQFKKEQQNYSSNNTNNKQQQNIQSLKKQIYQLNYMKMKNQAIIEEYKKKNEQLQIQKQTINKFLQTSRTVKLIQDLKKENKMLSQRLQKIDKEQKVQKQTIKQNLFFSTNEDLSRLLKQVLALSQKNFELIKIPNFGADKQFVKTELQFLRQMNEDLLKNLKDYFEKNKLKNESNKQEEKQILKKLKRIKQSQQKIKNKIELHYFK